MDVLDIGSTGQTDAYDLWPQLRKVARSLTGIDVVPREDPSIVTGNMESYHFDRSFDVVVAGDVLEHVMNQGLLLENIKRHLRPAGRLIITTPNAKWPTVIVPPNPTHTLWHDRYTLRYLLQRCGYEIEVMGYYLGNKLYYHPIVRPLVWRQGLLVVCSRGNPALGSER